MRKLRMGVLGAMACAGCTSAPSTVTFHVRAAVSGGAGQLVVSDPTGAIRSTTANVAIPSDTVIDVEAGDAVTFAVQTVARRGAFTIAAVEPGDDLTYTQPTAFGSTQDMVVNPPQAPSPSGCQADGWAMSWQADGSTGATGFYFMMSYGLELGTNTWEGIAPPDARALTLPDGLVPASTHALITLDGYTSDAYASYADWRRDPGLWAARAGEHVAIDHCGIAAFPPDPH